MEQLRRSNNPSTNAGSIKNSNILTLQAKLSSFEASFEHSEQIMALTVSAVNT